MLTNLTIRNFKKHQHVVIPLGNPVVFAGPHNSGKTSALQALTLWQLGLDRWVEHQANKWPDDLDGVDVLHKDLPSVQVPASSHLWHDLNVGKPVYHDELPSTESRCIEVTVEGVSGSSSWVCGFEFYATDWVDGFYCLPRRTPDGSGQRREVPDAARDARIEFLRPLSGLSARETLLLLGAVNVRIGDGRAGEVLRSLCWHVTELPDGERQWNELANQISTLFGVRLDRPELVPIRGEVELAYTTREGANLDLTASGRGMQHALLLLAFMKANPGIVILLDSPATHMDADRQREIYGLLRKAAYDNNSQMIMASHSEAILNEAAKRGDKVLAFG